MPLHTKQASHKRHGSYRAVVAVWSMLIILAGCAVTDPPNDESSPATTSATAVPAEVRKTEASSAATAEAKIDAVAKPAPSAANAPTPAPAPPPATAASTNPADRTPPVSQRGAQGVSDTSRLYTGTGQFVRPQPATPPAAKGPEEFTLNFEMVDIRAVVQSILGDMLRESFTIHPQTTGNVTIRLSRAIPRTELMPILETLLRQNGQVMVREDGIYKVMPAGVSTKGSITPQVMTTPAQLPNGYSVQIVQLRYAGVRDMARILEPYATEPQSSVRVDELRNLVILSGTQRELKHMLEVIDIFDVDYLAGFSIGLFTMQTDVKSLTADLDRIFGGASGATAPGAAGGSASPLAGIVRIVPIERLNGLLVITTQPRYLDEAKKWIDRLDKAGGLSGGMRLNVYPVQNGRADRLAQLLSEIYGNRSGSGGSGPTLAPGARPATTITTTPTLGGQAGQQGGGAGAAGGGLGAFITNLFQSSGTAVSKDTKIVPDNDNNALVILATPSDFEVILSALRQLDVPRRQVLVEVMIAEVTLKDELKFGIEWFMKAGNNTVGALRNTVGDGAVLPRTPIIPGGTADLRGLIPTTRGLQLINAVGGDIRGIVQALGEDGRAQIQFAPKILILDNEKGVVNVGSRISVNTGTSTGTGGNTVTTNQYIDTGVLLTVTPRINAGGRVTMELNQEVSSANRAVTGNNNPDIDNRKAQTTVNVASGESMVLAGLIREQRDTATGGVPFLSKIPVLGGLFGTQSRVYNRTELVVMITPTVITNNEEARAVTEELRKKLPGLESLIPKKVEVTVESVK